MVWIIWKSMACIWSQASDDKGVQIPTTLHIFEGEKKKGNQNIIAKVCYRLTDRTVMPLDHFYTSASSAI